MTHSIESYVLPTHHGLDGVKITEKESETPAPTVLSDAEYPDLINFYAPAPNFKSTYKVPAPGTVAPELYRAIDEEASPDTNLLKYLTFDPRKHITPNVLWFQPYDKSSQSIELSLTSGFKIILEEIDGVTIPLPNNNMDLSQNNSFYLQGSVPVKYINSYFPSTDDEDTLCVQIRQQHRFNSQPMSFGIRNGCINALPILGNESVCPTLDDTNGFTEVKHHADATKASTILAWKSDSTPRLPDTRLLLWSSYRYVDENTYEDTKSILFLRVLTGTSVTLSRTPPPSSMIPS